MLRIAHTWRAIRALILGWLVTAACASQPRAPSLPDGQRLALTVVLECAPTPDAPAEKAAELRQVAAYMEPDLVQLLRSAGYDAAPAAASRADQPTPGGYTLKVRIVDYAGGRRSARMFVGFGTGAARLNSDFELLGPRGERYTSGSPGASITQSDWRRVVHKVDAEIVAAVNQRLSQGL